MKPCTCRRTRNGRVYNYGCPRCCMLLVALNAAAWALFRPKQRGG